jgi:hypothetical protein
MQVVKRIIGVFFLWLVLFTGCTATMDLESMGMEPKLVITGVLSTDRGSQIVEILATVPYFGKELPENIQAKEVLLNGEPLTWDPSGVYVTKNTFAAEEGKTYKLEVWIDFDNDGALEYYWATTTVPYIHTLEALSLRSILPSGNDVPFFLMVGFYDTPGEDYYGAALWINNVLYSNRILRYYVHTINDYTQDGEYIRYPIPEWIIMSSLIWDNEQTFDLYAGDVLTVELQTLSKEYYEYLQQAKIEKNQHFPLFSGPRGNVKGNIHGGALGIFGSYASSRKSVVLPECPGLPNR